MTVRKLSVFLLRDPVRCATWLPAFILVAGTLSTLAALPFFRFGVWRDSEPTVITVFAIGAMSWSWVGYLFYRKEIKQIPHAIAACLFLALWCSLVSIFSPFPLLSFLGSPQLGEGAALFLCWSGLSLLAWKTARNKLAMRSALIAGIFMVLYTSAASHVGEESSFELFGFTDFVGVFAVLLPILVHCLCQQYGLSTKIRIAIVIVGFSIAMLISLDANSKGAVLALTFSFLVWAGSAMLFGKEWPVLQRRAVYLSIATTFALPLTVMAMLYFAGQTVDIYQQDSAPDLPTGLYSMISRGLMLNLSSHAFDDNGAMSYLFGNGFGHSLFYIQNYLSFSGQSFLYPNWDVFYRDFVHTHSIPYEVLLSGGIVALTLYISVFALWIHQAAPEHKAIVIATALGYLAVVSIWFEFSTVIPLLALVMGATLSKKKNNRPLMGFIKSQRIGLILSLTVIVALSSSAGWLYWLNKCLDRERFLDLPVEQLSIQIPDDGARGNISLQRAFLNGCRDLADHDNTQNVSERKMEWCENLIRHVYNQVSTEPTSSLVLAYLVITADFSNLPADAPAPFQDIKNRLVQNWGNVAAQLINVAPLRIDTLIPYFSYLSDTDVVGISRHQGDQILDEFAQRYPSNPIVLWFDGQRKINSTSRQTVLEGLSDMIDAIQNYNLERYIALSDDILDKLHNARDKISGK